jgi:hypothetical protein
MCRERILPDARLCKHCGAYQGWRKHLSLSSTVLALLVALISVATASIPVVVKAWTPHRSDVQLTVSRASFDTIFVVASNYGDRPGSVAGAAILSIGKTPLSHAIILTNGQNQRFIPAGASRELGFRIPAEEQAYLSATVMRVQGTADAITKGSIMDRLPRNTAIAGLLLRTAQFGAQETKILTGIPVKCSATCNWGM